jgi:hypothetical protein
VVAGLIDGFQLMAGRRGRLLHLMLAGLMVNDASMAASTMAVGGADWGCWRRE